MAARRSKDDSHEEQSVLTVARSEARDRINTQIAKGKQILSQQLNNQADVALLQGNYKKWNDFNIELLRFLFSGDRFWKEYDMHGLVSFVTGGGIHEDIRVYRELTTRAISELESLEQRLDIIPESPSRQEARDSRNLRAQGEGLLGAQGSPTPHGNKVFIVHGHDGGLKETVARFVARLVLEPVILHEKPNEGNAIIEKFERHSRDASFAVVLLTPDDKGGATESDPGTYRSRARQNVVLELGYFLGSLGRRKVCALYSEGVELPSDMSGILYIPVDSGNGWRLALAREIKASGFDVDLNKAF